MNVTVRIPDDLARRLGGPDDATLLRRVLDFGTRAERDGFLKAHGVSESLTPEDRPHPWPAGNGPGRASRLCP